MKTHAAAGTHAPESLMMTHGYRPELSEGAAKCPIFQTSTFAFRSAEEGKQFFEVAYGLREPRAGEEPGLIYSRINNPDMQILEERLALWDRAESCAVFASGMAAIATALLAHLRPGDVLLHSEPLYGGTDHLIKEVLAGYGVRSVGFMAGQEHVEIEAALAGAGAASRLALIFLDTPANPTNALVDIALCAALARRYSTPERQVVLAVDNTFLGPLWQHPLEHGADLVLYSATKYIGGHSDLIAGACLGSAGAMEPVRSMRTFLGTVAGPWTAWLLLRSLETLKLRMERQAESATAVADYLACHPAVERVRHLGTLAPGDPQYEVYRRQCSGPGAMISLDVVGGEPEAFRFINALKLFQLAVSLGSTESLVEHPATMTHAGVDPGLRARAGVTAKTVRLSIGVERVTDLLADVEQALDATGARQPPGARPLAAAAR